MILDAGICEIYRVESGLRGPASPADGLKPMYQNWYGVLRHQNGGGSETGDHTMRIRIHKTDVRECDIACVQGTFWRITRVYHGTDDETWQPITDLSMEAGERVFILGSLCPRKIQEDDLNTQISFPNTEAARAIWMSVGSVNEADYYESERMGITLSGRAEIYAAEYADEPYVMLSGQMYEARRIERRGPMVYLYLEAMREWRE